MKTKEEIEKMIDNTSFETRDILNKRYYGVSYTDAIHSALNWVIEKEDNLEDDIREALKQWWRLKWIKVESGGGWWQFVDGVKLFWMERSSLS